MSMSRIVLSGQKPKILRIFSSYQSFRSPMIRMCSKVTKTEEPAKEKVVDISNIHRRMHAPDNFQKRILVWTGMYKSLDEIPRTVPVEKIEKARNKARIRISNYMMALTAFACLCMVISGKRAAEKGETLTKINRDWHQSMKAEEERIQKEAK